jgi:hypothetical protein
MHYTPPGGTLFYRLTAKERSWSEVLSGAGAYFSPGGRYNRVHQKTVYTAEDPLVIISEYAFHLALDLQRVIGGGPLTAVPTLPGPVPFVTDHLLWCFTLPDALLLVDVEDPAAVQTYHHRPYELLNPTSSDYHSTAMLADLIRHPNPQSPSIGGILAPSVRTVPVAGYVPRQHIFFVPHNATAIPGKRLRQWTLTLEFGDTAGQSVTAQTRDIDWARPWFRLGGARTPLPAYNKRPQAQPYAVGKWHQIEIRFV